MTVKTEVPTAKVRIPAPLRKHTKDAAEVMIQGNTVGEVINNLVAEYPDLNELIRDKDDKIRRFVNAYLNSEDIRHLKDLDSEVKDGDEVSIVPAIAGGI